MARNTTLTRQRGYSLVEALLVAAIAMMMMAIAVPVMTARDSMSNDARRMAADLERARSAAKAGWDVCEVEFDTATGRWRLTQGGAPLPGALADANGWRSVGAGVTIESVTFPAGRLRWLANGRPEQAGAVLLTQRDEQMQLSVTRLTGRVELVEVP